MANWTEQDLHVVGPQREIDRFLRKGFTCGGPRQSEDLLHFRRLCPLKRGEPRDTYTPDVGVVLGHVRTRTQALFSMITRWDYAAEFHNRLPRHWPRLSFACSVNGEMGDFGGVIVSVDGQAHNLVRDYDSTYVRAAHRCEIKRLLQRWSTVLEAGRDWCVIPDRIWNHTPIPFDAHFDDDFVFFFRSREEIARFKARYKASWPMRRVGGKWRRVRLK